MAKPSEEEISTESFKLKEMEIKKERIVKLTQIITTGVVVTALPAIINYQIQNQELEIKRLGGEISYLEKFSPQAVLQDDLLKRRIYVEYLATIAHSEGSRDRWNAYLKIIDDILNEKEDAELKLEALVESDKSVVATDGQVDEKIASVVNERAKIIKRSQLDEPDVSTEDKITSLVFQMNSDVKAERISAVATLIQQYRTYSFAISSALDQLTGEKLNRLSASGRINVLVFLRNSSAEAWDRQLVEKANEALKSIRNRATENGMGIGPQTDDALKKLEAFIKKINITMP
nr:hypothetical protein [uncultured Desulfobacter sp.]